MVKEPTAPPDMDRTSTRVRTNRDVRLDAINAEGRPSWDGLPKSVLIRYEITRLRATS